VSEELPEGWAVAQLREIAAIKGGITKGQKRRATDVLRTVPYLRVANVQRGYLDLEEIKEIEATEDEIAELRLLPGDILLIEGGNREHLGRGWIWQGEVAECIHQNHIFRARLRNSEMEPCFFSWYANHVGQGYFHAEASQTVNLASINLTKLSSLPVAVAPLAEQKRIVAKIQALLARVDGARQRLAKMRAILKRLRQSVLAAACSGRLTADWRAGRTALEHQDLSETMPNLNDDDLPELPEHWSWVRMDDVCSSVQDGTHFSPKEQSGHGDYKYITAKNIKESGLDLSDVTFIPADVHRSIYARCNPQKGDVLYIKDGATTGIA
jgi:restriction endonuclease S subunit